MHEPIGGAVGGVPLVEIQAAALASVSDAVMITDQDGVIAWVNDAFTTMSGYSAEEAVGATPRLLQSGEHDHDYYRRLWGTILAGRRWRAEVVEQHKDGHHYRVMQTITPVVGGDGEVHHFVAVHENVTELRSSQARLQALFDHALDGLLLYDDDGRLVDANPALSRLSGFTCGQMDHMTLQEVFPADYRRDDLANWQTLRETGSVRGTAPLVRADGQRIDVEFQSVADIVPGVHLSIVRDVTDQRRMQATERFQSQLLEAAGEAVIATDLDGTVIYWNPAAEQLYGWRRDDAVGRDIVDLIVPEPLRALADEARQLAREGRTWSGRYEGQRADGTRVPVWATGAPFYDADGRPAGVIGVYGDITELEAARQALADRVRQQAVVAELGRFALHTDDPRAVAAEAERRVSDLLDPALHVEVRWMATADAGETAEGDGDVLAVPIAAVGTLCVSGTDARTGLGEDDEEFLRAVALVVSAAVRHHEASSELQHLATHDALTGLPNRTLFIDRLGLAAAAATRSGRGYAVLFLDFDGFKTINDSLGHEAGDEILQGAAHRLRQMLRPTDSVARFGGDEFAILCPDLDDQACAEEVARRVHQALAIPFETSHGPLTVTASIGIVVGDATAEPARLLRDADAAMYAAKDNGRNRIEHFDTHMHELAHRRLEITAHLRGAITGEGVVVHYQPMFELATGRLVGVEALVRLRQADGSLLAPGAFIDIAEESGLIGILGQRVLEITCVDATAWLTADPDFQVSVNLSPRQFTDPDLADGIARTLEATGVPAKNLWLEITESALLTGPHVHHAIRTLRLSGVNFAIDDFGTGYSSLAHLRNTPVDALKIDRGFVDGLLDHSQDHALIVASLDLARTFGLVTIAEGVETALQAQELTHLGCIYAQGYLWSPPIPAEQLTAMLEAQPMAATVESPPDRKVIDG